MLEIAGAMRCLRQLRLGLIRIVFADLVSSVESLREQQPKYIRMSRNSKSPMGHSRPTHSAPVPLNSRCCRKMDARGGATIPCPQPMERRAMLYRAAADRAGLGLSLPLPRERLIKTGTGYELCWSSGGRLHWMPFRLFSGWRR